MVRGHWFNPLDRQEKLWAELTPHKIHGWSALEQGTNPQLLPGAAECQPTAAVCVLTVFARSSTYGLNADKKFPK